MTNDNPIPAGMADAITGTVLYPISPQSPKTDLHGGIALLASRAGGIHALARTLRELIDAADRLPVPAELAPLVMPGNLARLAGALADLAGDAEAEAWRLQAIERTTGEVQP